MKQEDIKRYYWVSRITLELSKSLYGLDNRTSTQLLEISRNLCSKLEDIFDGKSEDGNDEIREEIQRYVNEIREQDSD